MKRLLILIAILFWHGSMLTAWASPGSWRSHFAYHDATQCVVVNDKVYVVSDGSLYSYTPKDDLVECYDKSNILSDRRIRHIAVCERSKTLVVVYDNANIDLVRPNGDVVNIADYANEPSFDPMVNDLRVINGKAYLSTNFGATVLDVEREEFADTYKFGRQTYSCAELDGVIYAATEDGLYRGDMGTNLLDMVNWQLLSNDIYEELTAFDSQLIGLNSNDFVYCIDVANGAPALLREGPFNFIHCADSKLIIGNKTLECVYATLTDFREFTFDGTINSFTVDGDTYWTSNGAKGLNGYRYDKNKGLIKIVTSVSPNSPIRSYCQYLNVVDDGRLLVAGGYLNYYGYTFYTGTLMMYDGGIWSSFEEEGITKRTAGHYKNMTSIVQDPTDPSHHYASSFGQGIYEFRDMKFIRQYTHQAKEGLEDVVASSLESAIPTSYEYTRISRLQYDKLGNLWITNGHAKSPLKIMKPNGEFLNLYYKELENLPTVTEVLFGSNGWLWVVSMRSPVQLFCIDMNGTLENTEDDLIRVFGKNFVDQDGGEVEIYYINDIAEDINEDIWVMTDKGPYVLYNTENAFEDNYCFTKIKIPRNDGTNYADYLLDGAYTTCVEVDAANRKWIGTLNNGLYLISADGQETIHHFTSENSPLPSNNIESLALCHESGELYVGTDKGIVSYMGDAMHSEENYDEDKVYAYPNPVTPDYDGLITIVGLKANSHVKVVNTSGRLVAEGTSLGGAFTWDGRTPLGQRVSTGVYYVMGSDENGKEGIVTKILFVK